MVSGEWLAHGDTLVMCMESSRKILDESSVEDDDTQTEEPFGDAPTDTKAAENLGRKNSAKENSSKQESTIMFENRADSGNEPISILIEIVGATLPKQLISGGVKWEDSRGMHCTAHWVGPPNPSGRKRKEELLHRTKSLKVDGGSKNAKKIIDMEDETHEDDHHVEHIFTVDDKSLFLFKTTMKQLVNASPKSSSASSQPPSKTDSEEGNAIMRKGGIRFDVFLKPLDALSTVSSYIAASTVSEKEASAITSCESSFSSSMMASYRLMGSIFLTADDILNRCTEERFEVNLNGKLRQIQQNPQLQISTGFGQPGRTLNKPNTDGRLALRMRLASDCDKAFLKSLAASDVCYDVVKNYATLQSSISRHDKCYTNALKPLQLLTEIDENVLAAQSSIKALSFHAQLVP